MKRILPIFLCAIFLALPVLAENSVQSVPAKAVASVNSLAQSVPDVATKLELQQQKLDFFKERLDSQDKRISDLNIYIMLDGVLITLLVVILGFKVKHDAVQAAKEEAQQWVENEGKPRLEELIEEAKRKIREATSPVIRDLKRELDNARESRQNIDKMIEEYSNNLEKLTRSLNEKIDEMAEKSDSTDTSPQGYFNLGITAFHEDKFEIAVDYFEKSSESSIKPFEVAAALVNKGVALSNMEKNAEAIAVYDAVAQRYGDAPEARVREQVAKALVNKGVTLSQMGENDEAIAVCEEVKTLYGAATEAGLRQQVALALVNKGVKLGQMGKNDEAIAVYDEVVKRDGDSREVGMRKLVATALYNMGVRLEAQGKYEGAIHAFKKAGQREGDEPYGQLYLMVDVKIDEIAGVCNREGFASLCEAKKFRLAGNEPGAKSLLARALSYIKLALECAPDWPMAMGNQGYILFLQGEMEKAREILAKAIQLPLGGEKLRQDELADADIHPLPQDVDFKALVNSL